MWVNCTALVTSHAKPIRYLLTDPRQFDILQAGSGWRESNAIRSIETTRVHHAAWRRGSSVAARSARAAAEPNAAYRPVDEWTATDTTYQSYVAAIVEGLRQLRCESPESPT